MSPDNAAQSRILRMTDAEFADLTGFVKQKYGIDLTKKRVLIESRLSFELNQRGFTSFRQYLDSVKEDQSGNEMTTMLNKLTTNLSFFMREQEHFTFMEQELIPYFLKTRKNNEFRIWSAGCSSGQEAYNIAMVLDQYFGARKGNWDTTILATDISMKVLTKAQKGIYTEQELSGLPPAWRTKYLVPRADGTFQICDKIRRVIFQTFNLMDPIKFRVKFDVIFCRNVMIYFDGPTKDSIINKFYNATSEGGFLFIGHSESIGNNSRYQYVKPAIYQRRS